MAKKALCIGINDYPYEGFDLLGCINDANAWAELLFSHYDFPRSDIKLLTNAEAKKKDYINGIKSLLAGAASGDVLVFTNSSHGSYLADKSGDEEKYDQVICPYDVKENILLDDELREIFSDLKPGVRLTVISDSCHSGTVTRAIPIVPPSVADDIRMRFMDPHLRGDRELQNVFKARPKRREVYPEAEMKELLLAGCKDIEYSYDARIRGVYHGAMSCFALQAIRDANYKITYAELVKRVRKLLDEVGFPQHPQLEGRDERKNQQIFV